MSPITQAPMIPVSRLPALRSTLAALLGTLGATLRTWQIRVRQRRELRDLDDAVLRDVGISRAQARFSAEKPFWRE